MRTRSVLLLLCLSLLHLSSDAQFGPGTGLYAFGSFDNRGFDTINLGSLNTHFSIPIISKQGRGQNFNYNLVYDGLIWSPVAASGTTTWKSDANWGFHGELNGSSITGYLTNDATQALCYGPHSSYIYYISSTSNYVYHDPFGANHLFNYSSYSNCPVDQNGNPTNQPPVYSGDGSSSDNSGYTFAGGSLKSKNGASISAPTTPNGNGSITDTNGNIITNSGGVITDTLGVAELKIAGGGSPTSPSTLTYPVANQANSATSATVSIVYKAYTVQTNFKCSGIVDQGATSVNLVDHITLPDSAASTYTFTYEATSGVSGAVTGRLASIKLPTGGTISYTYYGGTNGIVCADGTVPGLNRVTTDGTRTYQRAGAGTNAYTTTVTDEKINQTLYNFSVDAKGKYEETHRQVYQGSTTSGSLLEIVYTCYNSSLTSCDGQAITPPITAVNVTTSYNGGSQDVLKSSYDSYGNLLNSAAYSGSTLLAQTANTYNVNSEILSTKTTDGSGNTVALSTYGYDETAVSTTSGLPQHGAGASTRGNQTSSHISIDGSNTNTLTTTAYYYDTGMPVWTTAPGGFKTTYGYDSTQAFPTSTTLPLPSSGAALSTSATYDPTSGVLLTSTGLNTGQTFTATQYDPLLRLTTVTTPEAGQTKTTYSPNQISASTKMSASQSTDQETFLDTYGRVKRVARASSSGWYLTDSCYDADGLLQYQSTPYVSSSENPSSYNCSSGTATQYTYDALGRKTAVAQPDGSSVAYTYLNRAVKSATSTGVVRVTQYDTLGRITGVCEVSSNNSMPGSGTSGSCGQDIAANGYGTGYSYSLSGHSTTVVQGIQQKRVFTTDAAGRTTQTVEPEAGTTNYTYAYNSTGLVMTRTRPRANQTNASVLTATTTQYDALGRVVSISYNDGTPTKSFGYDLYNGSKLGSSSGQLISASNNNGGGLNQRLYTYDVMGRVSNTNECWVGQCNYSVLRWYGYDLASNMTTEQYATQLGGGSPATLTYSYNTAGQLLYVNGTQGSGSNGTNSYSVSPNTMTPFGPALTELGNSLFTTYTYNAVGRLGGASTCAGSQQVGCTGGQTIYAYTATTQGDQVKQSSDTVLAQQLNYGYDDFGRLQTVNNTSGSGPALGMSFVYDWWGNRWQQNVTAGSGPQPQLSYNTNTNQVVGYSYDAAGNLTNDQLHSYTYDAENNLTAIDGGSTAQYQYGAFNERLFAAWGGQYARYGVDLRNRRSTTFVNGSLSVNGVQFYAGNQKHAYWSSSDNNFHFEHTDWLGTVRVRTNSVGAVEGSYGSLPFGDGLTQSGSDANLNHFTGLDADVGDGANLAHATFREYGSTAGRWTSPDPYLGSYDATNPQSLNRYSYVLNNPLAYIDPDGTSDDPCGDDPNCVTVTTSPLPPVETLQSPGTGAVSPVTAPTYAGSASAYNVNNPCFNLTLLAAGVNINQRNTITKYTVLAGSFAGVAGALGAFGYLVHSGGPYDDKNHSGPGTPSQRVAAGNISYGVTCPFGAGFCQFAAGAAQTAAGEPDPNGTLSTGYDTPSDNASIKIGQAMRAAGCH